jgi:hypothetical protein
MIEGQQHVNDLTRRQKIKIEFLPGRTYTATAPSLLAQLRAAAASSTTGHGGRTIPDSRMPLNADALDLWTGIVYSTHGWANVLRLDRRPYREPPLAVDGLGDFALPPTGRLLRAVYATAVGVGWAVAAETIGRRAGTWLARIDTMFAGERTGRVLPLRDYPCRECGAREVVDERDGERYRMPAVQAQLVDRGSGEMWPYLTCLACGDNGLLPYRSDSYTASLARMLAQPIGEAA